MSRLKILSRLCRLLEANPESDVLSPPKSLPALAQWLLAWQTLVPQSQRPCSQAPHLIFLWKWTPQRVGKDPHRF